MNDRTTRSDAGILDVLFAVALGEGYLEGIAQNREQILSGAAFTLGPPGQDLYRVALAFLVILLSWIYYRRTTLPGHDYGRGEFAVDTLVIITYLTMFAFVDEAVVFAWILALIWTLYLLARVVSGQRSMADLGLGPRVHRDSRADRPQCELVARRRRRVGAPAADDRGGGRVPSAGLAPAAPRGLTVALSHLPYPGW